MAQSASNEPNKNLSFVDDTSRSKWSGNAIDGLAGIARQIGSLYHVNHFDLSVAGAWNSCAQSVRSSTPLTRLGFPADFLATVHGYGLPHSTRLQWSVDDKKLPAGQSLEPQPDTAPVVRSDVPLEVGGPHVISMSVEKGDRMPVDDIAWRIVDVASELKVLIVEGDRGAGPLDGSGAFLQLALSPPGAAGAGARSMSYLNAELISDLELPGRILRGESAVMLANVAQVSAEEADQLAEYVKGGGTLLLFMGEAVNADAYNQTLLPRGLLPGPLVKRIGDASAQKNYPFDFKPNGNLDPILRAFAGEENSGLDTAQVFSYWQIDLPAGSNARRVLNYLPDRGHADPAITLSDLGSGRVVFFSTSANAQWTTLPAKPSYVTLMHELVAGAIRGNDGWMNLSCGEPLIIPSTLPLPSTPTLTDSQQKSVALLPPSAEQPTYHSNPLTNPGVYRLSVGDRSMPIAVNVPEGSADIRPVNATEISQALGGIPCNMLGDSLPALDVMSTAGSDYGWSVMLILLLLLATECVLAMRFGSNRR